MKSSVEDSAKIDISYYTGNTRGFTRLWAGLDYSETFGKSSGSNWYKSVFEFTTPENVNALFFSIEAILDDPALAIDNISLAIPSNNNQNNNTNNNKLLLGDVNGDGRITIVDALEILKYLAGMNSIVEHGNDAWNRALITGGKNPVISDAIEIFKHLAGMSSLIQGRN